MPTLLTDKVIRTKAQASIIGPLCAAGDHVSAAVEEQAAKRKELADRLRALREQERISLRDVARVMRRSAAYVSDVELGRRNLLEDFAKRYVEAVIQLRKARP